MSEHRGITIIVSLLTVALTAVAISAQTSAPLGPGHPAYGPKTGCAVASDLSMPLRDMIPRGLSRRGREGKIISFPTKYRRGISISRSTREWTQPSRSWHAKETMPGPVANWDGIPNLLGVNPPDTQGDVGPNHYVQWINVSMQIWDKTGHSLWGPYNGNTIWSGFGGPADSSNDGDPIVLYDRLADRWLISQFALPHYPNGPFYQYIAISQTGDPTGSWYRYAFKVSDTLMNDYPKLGVWPDGYYMSVNEFGTSGWAGVGVYVFDRTKMLAGDPTAAFQMFDLGTVSKDFGPLQPSHLEGSASPASGEPNTFVQFWDSAWGVYPDSLLLWEFHVDWTNPSASTFGLLGQPNVNLTTDTFDSNMCNYQRTCIRQPGTSARVDAISDRLMYRVQYRRFPTYRTLVLNHTVDADGADHAGIRWYEVRDSGSGWGIFQQGTYAPDSDNRWMASAAMDGSGDIAVGYSVSSTTTYPSIRYAGRTPADTLGTLGQGEQTLIAGGGSQTAPTPHGAAGGIIVP